MFDCLPPRRFLMPFSTYKRMFYSLAVTAQSRITHVVQDIRRPPITGNLSFHTSKSRHMSNSTTDERSVTISSYPEPSANVDIGCDGA